MQAIIIRAYKDLPQLTFLINQVKSSFRLFISLDKKSPITISDVRAVLGDDSDAVIVKKYVVNWGGYNNLADTLYMLKLVSKQKDIDYVHVISGQDIIVRPIQDFASYTEEKKIYTDIVPFRDTDPRGTQDRLTYFYLLPNADPHEGRIKKNQSRIRKIQTKLNIPRKKLGRFTQDEIYKGTNWVSMPMEAVRYCLDYAKKHPKFMFDIRHCVISEEFFFQTVLMNSRFRNDIDTDYRHYICWEHRNGSVPAYLDETDYDKIKDSGCFFARKIDSTISGRLREMFSYVAETYDTYK